MIFAVDDDAISAIDDVAVVAVFAAVAVSSVHVGFFILWLLVFLLMSMMFLVAAIVVFYCRVLYLVLWEEGRGLEDTQMHQYSWPKQQQQKYLK